MYVRHATQTRLCNSCCSRKATIVISRRCVFLGLDTKREMCMDHIVINKLPCCIKLAFHIISRVIKLYKHFNLRGCTNMCHIVAFGTWVLKENIVQKLLIFERKILRGMFGSTKENQTWKIKNNEEMNKLIKHENTVNYIKAQRLSWFVHIQRMPEARATKKIFKWNPLTTRPIGRHKYRWEKNIIKDFGQMKIKFG